MNPQAASAADGGWARFFVPEIHDVHPRMETDLDTLMGVLPGSAPAPVAKPSALGGLTVALALSASTPSTCRANTTRIGLIAPLKKAIAQASSASSSGGCRRT